MGETKSKSNEPNMNFTREGYFSSALKKNGGGGEKLYTYSSSNNALLEKQFQPRGVPSLSQSLDFTFSGPKGSS